MRQKFSLPRNGISPQPISYTKRGWTNSAYQEMESPRNSKGIDVTVDKNSAYQEMESPRNFASSYMNLHWNSAYQEMESPRNSVSNVYFRY